MSGEVQDYDKGHTNVLTRHHEVQLYLNNSLSYPISLIDKSVNPEKLKVKISYLTNNTVNSDSFASEICLKNLRKYPYTKMEQEEYGAAFSKTDVFIFTFKAATPTKVTLLISLYQDDPTNQLYGQTFVDGVLFEKSSGVATLPLVSPDMKKFQGHISVDYLVIKPWINACKTMNGNNNVLDSNRRCLNIGHRGSGASFTDGVKKEDDVTENTLSSFKAAAANGADFIEFDVLMTKDNIPIIFHDFHVGMAVSLNEGSVIKYNIPLNMLKYDQLQQCFVVGESSVEKSKGRIERTKSDPGEKLCPSLQEALEKLPRDLGFLIELKYPQMLLDGSHELESFVDPNIFVDGILDVVYHYGGSRKIIFCCFEPSIVSMLKSKQNCYPVMLCTSGENKSYTPYLDLRTRDICTGIAFALSENVEGLSLYVNPIKDNMKEVRDMLAESNLKMFTWGTDNNNFDLVKRQREAGVDAVIHDSIAEFGRF